MRFTRSSFIFSLAGVALGWPLSGCAPDVADDPVPEALEFELTPPPRAPEPSSLIVNPVTGRIDFSLAGISLPDDCASQRLLWEADCEFNRYLETLDGYPTTSSARAPATAELDVESASIGDNVVVVAARAKAPVTDVTVRFDPDDRALVLDKASSWERGEFYWIGIRGYERGVRASSGAKVVGSPTQFLLKQERPLTCGAKTPAELDPSCPALSLVSPGRTSAEAAAALFQLEAIRQAYVSGGGFALMEAFGLPKAELAVLWGFPIHTASVAELDPTAGIVPRVTRDEIRVLVQGTIDPATIEPIGLGVAGTVALIDLDAAAAGDFAGAFPSFSASFADSEIVIAPAEELVDSHRYGLFFTDGLRDLAGDPLVASPVSKLLTLEAELLTTSGASAVSSLSKEQAVSLEAGRRALSPLFDEAAFAAATGIRRDNLVYCFAFSATSGEAP